MACPGPACGLGARKRELSGEGAQASVKKRGPGPQRSPRWPGVRIPEDIGTELGTWQAPDPCVPQGRVRRKRTAAGRQGELAEQRGPGVLAARGLVQWIELWAEVVWEPVRY